MIIMTLKIITEIVNQIKSNQNKRKKKRNNKSQTKTHTQKEEKKKKQQEQNKKKKQNKTNIVRPKWNRGMQKEVLIPKI